jgi:hypothetical protein
VPAETLEASATLAIDRFGQLTAIAIGPTEPDPPLPEV